MHLILEMFCCLKQSFIMIAFIIILSENPSQRFRCGSKSVQRCRKFPRQDAASVRHSPDEFGRNTDLDVTEGQGH